MPGWCPWREQSRTVQLAKCWKLRASGGTAPVSQPLRGLDAWSVTIRPVRTISRKDQASRSGSSASSTARAAAGQGSSPQRDGDVHLGPVQPHRAVFSKHIRWSKATEHEQFAPAVPVTAQGRHLSMEVRGEPATGTAHHGGDVPRRAGAVPGIPRGHTPAISVRRPR